MRRLEPFVGRMVEISGTLKRADLENDDDVVGTSGTTASRPSGSFGPLGQDLRLYEVNVMSFREVTAQAQATGTAGVAEQPATAEADQQGAADVEQPEQSFQAREELPRTASPLPLAGLLGVLSLAGALGVRRIRR